MDKIYRSENAYKILKKAPNLIKVPILHGLCEYRRYQLKKLQTPKVLVFFVTNRCNAKCGHCFYWKELNTAKDQEMKLSQIETMVQSLKEKLVTLVLTGGEPFLKEELVSICCLFKKYDKASKIIIPTNGLLADRICSKVREIVEKTGLDLEVIVSIDGLSQTQESIRGVKEIFAKCEKTIEQLKEIANSHLKISLMTTISKQNYREIGDLIAYNKTHWNLPHRFQFVRSCNEVYKIDPAILEGFYQKDKESILPPLEELDALNRLIESQSIKDDLSQDINHIERRTALEILRKQDKVVECVAGSFDAVIYPNGNVAFCEMTKPFGNLEEADYDFYKLWTSEKANAMRGKIKGCSCIHSCNLIDSITHDPQSLKKLFDLK